MFEIIFALFIGIITIFIFIYFKYFKVREPESYIKINYVDFRENNIFDTISITINKTKLLKVLKIEDKSFTVKVFGFKNKNILKGELILMNSVRKKEKNFKMKIYKKSINIINIKINNNSNTYYNSEIIFYSKNAKQYIKLEGFEISNHNSKNRKRLLIYNENKVEIEKIIKDNNNDSTLQNKALEVIKNNSNKLLLIIIYRSDKKTHILIFIEEEKSLILPSKSEKQFFKNFYWAIYTNKLENEIIDSLAEEYKEIIIQNKKLFGQKLENLDDDQNINIYFSFINQGINSLLDNNIISRYCPNDYYFILGYILLLFLFL